MNLIATLKQILKRRFGVPEVEFALESLRSRGFSPRIIFDVGANRGEFAKLCHRVFAPPPTIYCFEPLKECAEILTSMEREGKLKFVPGLLGAKDQESVVLHEMDTASSVLSEHNTDSSTPMNSYPMATLDTLIDTGKCPSADFLKIDTQGYELEILKGCERNLQHVRVILAEVNFLDLHEGVPLAHELMSWLSARGFVVYDICSFIRRPLDRALWQSDFIFVKSDDPLRSDKRWTT